MGLDARLIAAHFVSPYRMEGRSGKNDATDAAAICEAASRPSMRFVPVKSCEQQGVMSLHRVREGFKEDRTACINRIRGVLAEFGLIFGKSPKVLRARLADVIEDAGNELSTTARLVVQRAFEHWRELDEHMRWCDSQVGQHVRGSPEAKRAAKITGIGELGASALVGAVGEFKQFGSAKHPINFAGMVARDIEDGDMPVAHWDVLSDAFLLDVREPVELEVESVPGAAVIPIGQLGARLDELPKDQEIHVICRSGQRAYYATRILLQKGYKARVLSGGMLSRAILVRESPDLENALV